MIKVYIRCNEGHYFNGEYCPFDAWSSDESKQLTQLSKKIVSEGGIPSFEELKKCGASDLTLSRTIVIDFGDSNFVFDAILPKGYFTSERFLKLSELPKEWL